MRIFAVSDLHTDFRENRGLLEQIPAAEYRADALIVAGDIADQLEVIGETLAALRARFARVFYTPGNHELWVRTGSDSVEKLHAVLELCRRAGVETAPGRAGDAWVLPLFSWYEPESGRRPADDAGDADGELAGWADFHFCRWPMAAAEVPAFFLKMNRPHLRSYDGDVVTFSHFLPRADLLPDREHLKFKALPEVAVCAPLDAQLRRAGSSVHVFGHSHIDCDRVIDGVRYVQNALKYPRERRAPGFPLKLIRDA